MVGLILLSISVNLWINIWDFSFRKEIEKRNESLVEMERLREEIRIFKSILSRITQIITIIYTNIKWIMKDTDLNRYMIIIVSFEVFPGIKQTGKSLSKLWIVANKANGKWYWNRSFYFPPLPATKTIQKATI